MTSSSFPWLTIVGLGEDGLAGLSPAGRAAIEGADLLLGGARHLELLPPIPGQRREPWPSPFARAYGRILAARGTPVCVVASGDPMWFGLGASLARRLPAGEMRVLPAPSSITLAAARLGWALQDVTVIALHGRPLATLARHLVHEARLILLSEDASTPARVAALVTAAGFGPSPMTVMEALGGPRERCVAGLAGSWTLSPGADLNLVALTCLADDVAPDDAVADPDRAVAAMDRRTARAGLSCLAGLPDAVFAHDGQITKRDQRAVTLAHLGPRPGELLWDIGAGSGSIAIEWMRSHPTCRAVAVEDKAPRLATIAKNAETLGVPGLRLIEGRAPEALVGLDAPGADGAGGAPDAVFIGGGLTTPGVAQACWEALKPGGRLVTNAVTLESEAMVATLRARWGGDLVRLAIAQAGPLGGFEVWRPAMPITLYSVTKP